MSSPLEILYESNKLIAIHKPHGLLVHRTNLDVTATEFALQLVRDQIGQEVHPCHRLDRKTSGVLLFAKDKTSLKAVRQIFESGEVAKTYLAIVRGFAPEVLAIDYALTNDGKVQDAQTELKRLRTFEIPVPHGAFPTSRYSLVELQPKTGRFHQLRKHMAHIRYPIIGDRPHGCNKQNKLWKERFEMDTMLLCATKLVFTWNDELLEITTECSVEFKAVENLLIRLSN